MSLATHLLLIEVAVACVLCAMVWRMAKSCAACVPVLFGCIAVGVGCLESLRGFNFHVPGITQDSVALLGTSTMRAGVYELGEEVGWKTATVPVPHHSQLSVLLRVKAMAINPSNFKHPMIPAAWPFVRHLRDWPIGYDVAGEVLSVGSASMCSGLKVGDKVWGMSLGVSSEYAVAPCITLAPVPGSVSFAEAAGFGVAGLTSMLAWQRSDLRSGQNALVIGASGGTGIFGVTIAAALGANVTGICSKRNVDFVRGLTPQNPVTVVDYTSKEQMDALIAGGPQFDVIYDTVSSGAPEDPDYEPQMRPLLKPGGMYEAIGGPMASQIDQVRAFVDVLTRPFGIRAQREAYDWFLLMPTPDVMRGLNSLFDAGKITNVPIDSTFDIVSSPTAMADAMDRQKSRRAVGKIVLTFGDRS